MMDEIKKIEEMMRDGDFPVESMARVIDISTADLEEILKTEKITEEIKKRIDRIYRYWVDARQEGGKPVLWQNFRVGKWD